MTIEEEQIAYCLEGRGLQLALFGELQLLSEKAMAPHSGTLAWTEEPGRLQSMGSRRVGHD